MPTKEEDVYLIVEAAGIGPSSKNYITSTTLTLNGVEHNLLNLIPYNDDLKASKRCCKIAIRISRDCISKLQNHLIVKSGRYKSY